jgi:hypothetical protein
MHLPFYLQKLNEVFERETSNRHTFRRGVHGRKISPFFGGKCLRLAEAEAATAASKESTAKTRRLTTVAKIEEPASKAEGLLELDYITEVIFNSIRN